MYVVAKKIILVGDDNPDMLKLLIKILTDDGYECYGAADTAGLIKLAKTYTPSLIVYDIAIPVLNGFLAIDRLSIEKVNIPVIFIAAFKDPKYLAESVRPDTEEILTPFDPSILLTLIKNVLYK